MKEIERELKNSLLAMIGIRNSIAVMPPKKNLKIQRKYDALVYKERHLIECFLVKLSTLGESFPDLINLQMCF